MKALLERGRRRRGHVRRPRVRRRAHRAGFDGVRRARSRPRRWDGWSSESGIARERDARGWRDLLARTRDHRLLGDGAHAAPATRSRTSRRSPTCCCCAAASAGRARASARCAATATCRATARWASTSSPAPAFLDALAREFGFAPPRAHGLDTVGAIEAMHAGRVRRASSRWAATSCRPRPTPTRTADALRALRADRARRRPSSTARTW